MAKISNTTILKYKNALNDVQATTQEITVNKKPKMT